MISNNGQQNLSSCAFAEQTAAYLYDEIGGAEKTGFESHLRNCRICAGELADFSALRSSISEWRTTDFEPLPTPRFILPVADNKTVSEKISRFAAIRAYFDFASNRAIATAALTALVMFGGLFWFASIYSRQENLAQVEKKTSQSPISVPTGETPPPPPRIAKTTSAADNDNRITPEDLSKPVSSDTKNDTGKNIVAPVKITTRTPVSAKPNKLSVPNTDKDMRPKTPVKNNIPTIERDEDEDNSLRLSDLFEEVGMNKSVEVNNE